jgi:hypothetical protein
VLPCQAASDILCSRPAPNPTRPLLSSLHRYCLPLCSLHNIAASWLVSLRLDIFLVAALLR